MINYNKHIWKGSILYSLFLVCITSFSFASTKVENSIDSTKMLVRIAEIEIYPEHIEAYNSILVEEAKLSMELEPGVICIFPMAELGKPTLVRIIEIYANQKAYEAHLKTPHFLKYKIETAKMVKSLKLPDMQALDEKTMNLIFQKMIPN